MKCPNCGGQLHEFNISVNISRMVGDEYEGTTDYGDPDIVLGHTCLDCYEVVIKDGAYEHVMRSFQYLGKV